MNEIAATAKGVRHKQQSTRFWALFAAPGTAWLLALFVVPFYAVLALAFGHPDPIFGSAIPEWNPLKWDATALRDALSRIFGGDLGTVVIRTFTYVGITLVICILVGYPVAYYVARSTRKSRGIILTALVLPFWISYLMRMLAWVNLLAPDGMVNRFLDWIGIFGGPKNFLNGNSVTVIIGLAYGYIPFFILPLYASLERMDVRLIEAARDLGASRAGAFWRITWPLSRQGLMAASVITVLPMFGDYYTNGYLSGSPNTSMIGNQIEYYLHGSTSPQTGAALVIVLSVLLVILMAYYLVSTARAASSVALR